jgi:hypothetical protein
MNPFRRTREKSKTLVILVVILSAYLLGFCTESDAEEAIVPGTHEPKKLKLVSGKSIVLKTPDPGEL